MYDIIIGRSKEEQEKLGKEAAFFLGKHYVKMGQTSSLSNSIYVDATKAHVFFIAGKRGSGKSYTMGAMAEGIMSLPESVRNNIGIVMLDTMGIYWTMKYDNEKEASLLKEWGLQPHGFNIKVYTPYKFHDESHDSPSDAPFSINPAELSASDWAMLFNVTMVDTIGVLISRVINSLNSHKTTYTLQEVIQNVHADDKSTQDAKNTVESLFLEADSWGLFSEHGISVTDLVVGSQITVLDVSCYASVRGSTALRALVIGLVCQKIFDHRMTARKKEEFYDLQEKLNPLQKQEERESHPLAWIMVDEAHEFLPLQGSTLASKSLITLLREGRQPGISLVLASQQPGQIHRDVMTQSDIVIAHRLTAKLDVDALSTLMQSYMREGLDKALQDLPHVPGAAVLFDDINERLYDIKVRPRITWHGGSAPSPLHMQHTFSIF